MIQRTFAVSLMSLAMPAMAGDFSLTMPIDCALGDTCFIQQYVDHDPGPGFTDFTCGSLSYDGHKGTDFALPSTKAMQSGVAVLAAADGMVVGRRDGEPDTGITGMSEGKDCGNGVLLRHPDGWETQYCHLKNGSVAVEPDQFVKRGTRLGDVGLSGRTEFPHLHLSVRHDGTTIDPFAPSGTANCQSVAAQTLWADEPQYRAGGLISVGISNHLPDYDSVKSGTAETGKPASDAPAIVVFAYGFGARSGDVLAISLTGPSGAIFEQNVELERQQAQYYRATGKRKPADGWPTGPYEAHVTLTRDATVLDQRMLTFDIN